MKMARCQRWKLGRGRCRFPLVLTVFLVFLLPFVAGAKFRKETRAIEPPKKYQPASFSGAVGKGFKVSMRATPQALQVEDPLLLTIRITATGPCLSPPLRPDLSRLNKFPNGRPRFLVESSPSMMPDRLYPLENTWEFDYRLRPRSLAVREIPGVPISFYNPHILFPDKRYLTAFTDAIPLQLKPRAEVKAEQLQGKRTYEVPDRFYQIATGSELLQEGTWTFFTGWWWVAALVLAPPGVCLCWYILWRRLFPDQKERLRRRRSGAALQALHSLRSLARSESNNAARDAGAAVVVYLQRRLDLHSAEPTPGEVAMLLGLHGYDADLCSRCAALIQACHEQRFAPIAVGMTGPGRQNLIQDAQQLIVMLEDAPCVADSL